MKKSFRLFLALCIIVAMLFSMTACGEKRLKGTIALDKEYLLLTENQNVKLTATFTPEEDGAVISDVVITWSSSKESVAVVDGKGKVTAVGFGKAVITAKYGNATASCNVEVIDLENRTAELVEDSRINISKHQNKMTFHLKKGLGYHYETGDTLVELLDEHGTPIPFTQNGDNVTVDWSGSVGMHVWFFGTKYKVLTAEVCHATHILSSIEDFGPLSRDWDEATKGNINRTIIHNNETRDWYVVLDNDISGVDKGTFYNDYTFGSNMAKDANGETGDWRIAVFQGTFDGRGYTLSDLKTRNGLITNLGNYGVIKNLALTGAMNYAGGGGILGNYGVGTVQDVFIEGQLYEQSLSQGGLYYYTNSSIPLQVKNVIVALELKGSWVNAGTQQKVNPGIFTSGTSAKPTLTNSYGISQSIINVDGMGSPSTGILYTSPRAFVESGAYQNFGDIWEIVQNSIFFGGKEVYSWL